MDRLSNLDTVASMSQRFLEVGEAAGTSRQSKRHAAKLAQKPLPFVDGGSFAAQHGVEDEMESFLPVLRKRDGLGNGVDKPAKDYLFR